MTYIEEKEFTWGVLAINIDKSFYLPNENSSIAIGVLDDAGLMVCDADVTLEIVDPLGGKTTLTTADTTIKISPQCEFYGVTDLPDYYTNYQVSVLGDYVMNLTAVTENGVRSIQDNFEVVAAVDFDVTRSGPTRIYPPVLYRMKFTVKANKGHSGPVKEYVPDSFVITPQEGMTVTTVGDAKVLTWNDETFVPGGTYDISYEFDAPDISPEFYLLGPLEIGAWKEGRQWQIANDAPNLTISSKVVDTNRVPFSGVGVDANLTDHDKTTKIIYAIEVDTGGNGDFRSPDNTTWSFRVNGGAWTQLTSASTPAKLIAAGDATFIDNETVSAGERIVNTACAGGVTPSLREHETGNPLSASSRVRNDECSETQASIDLSAAAFGDDFEFKIDQVENSGTEELIGLAHVIIAIGPPAQLAFSEQPTNTLSTASISPAIKVQVQDVDANLVTTATDSITLAINNNPSGGTLSGTLTVAAVSGEATFSNISIDKAGIGYTLDATATGLTTATSAGFNITGPDLEQVHYRWRNDDGGEVSASCDTTPWIQDGPFDAQYQVPSGCDTLTVKAWGAGGGGGAGGSADGGADGGGAGFAQADISVTAGEFLDIMVGGGGASVGTGGAGGRGSAVTAAGGALGGAAGGGTGVAAGSGGGYSAVLRSSTYLIQAGGGGGDGDFPAGVGGVGGGTSGGAGGGDPGTPGGAGTSSAGGAGGSSGGSPGSANTGGAGGAGTADTGAGGGGGSGLVTGTSTTLTAGLLTAAGNDGDANYGNNAGVGGSGGGISTAGVNGSPGRIVIIPSGPGGGPATFAAAEDAVLVTLAKTTLRRLRFEISNEGTDPSGAITYRLEVSDPNPASCSATTFSAVPTAATGHWQIVDSAYFSDGDPTSNIASGLTDENTTFVAGELKDTGNQTGGITLTNTEFTEMEYGVQATANATNGALYCFRLTNAGSTTDFTHTQYARATVDGVDNFLVEAAGGGNIGTQAAGTPFSIDITARDFLGNTVTGFTATADITSSGSLSAGGGTTVSFTNGVLSSHSVTISNTGSFTITATDSAGGLGTGTETGVTNSFTVDPGALDHFVVEAAGGGAIGTQTAAVAFNIQITAEDANNNTMTFFDGAGNTAEISSSGTLSAGSGTTATFTNGVLASHSVTITNTGSFTITATDSSGGLGTGAETGVSNSFTVDPGPLDHFLVEAAGGGAIGTQTAAIAFNIQITAQDANNNTVTPFDGAGNTVDISSTGTLSAGSGTTATFTNGVLASHSVTITNTGSFTITATDTAGGLGTGTETGVSNSFTVDPGPLDHFVVEAVGGGAIATQTAGTSFDIQITAEDANNNTMTFFDGAGNTVDISSTGTLSAGGGATAAFTNGVLASHSVTITNTGSFTITATDSVGGLGTGTETGVTNSFTVDPGALDHFVVEAVGGGAIGTQTAAVAFNIQITAEDANNNTQTFFDGAGNTVDISSTGTLSAGSGATATFTNGVLASHSVTITDTGSFTITATDSAGGLGTGTEVGVSNAFTVDPGPLDHFVVEAVGGGAIGTQIAGVAFNVQITAEDANNNTMTFFDGAGNTVEITSTGTLSAGAGTTATFTSGVLASHSVTITNTGSFTITATDSVGGLGTATETGISNSFTVDPAPLDHFVVELAGGGAIGTQVAAVAFNIQITAEDAFNNTMTTFDGVGNTADITSTGTLSGGSGTTATFASGVLASHSVTISNTGSFTITATDSAGGLGTGTEIGVSNAFTVDPGPLDHFLVEAVGGGAIGTQTAGAAFNIQITAEDANNNTQTFFDGAGNTVEITSTGTLSAGGGTTATFSNGVLASHSVTITNTGSFTITATDSAGGLGTGTEVGVSNSFTVDPGALDHFMVEAVGGGLIGTQTAGTAFNIQITAEDVNNNTVTPFDGAGNTVDISSTGTLSAGAGATATFTNGVLASHSVTITNTGSFTITATDSAGGLGTGTETGVTNFFTVDPGALDHFVLEAVGGGAIGTQTAGTSFDIQITAEDANNNTQTFFDGAGNTVDITPREPFPPEQVPRRRSQAASWLPTA